jgi:ubiquinone/menaquinone biosynthesis C-methylase UbiE
VPGGWLSHSAGLGGRSSATELMDTTTLPHDVADRTLRFLEMTNRRFGGTAVVLRYFDAWRPRWTAETPVTVLDVGTGAADIPMALVGWARDAGVDLRVTGIDSAPDIVAVARERVRGVPGIDVRQRSLEDVASSGERFDYVTASLFLHHVLPPAVPAALAAIDRVASRGVIIGDLKRSAGTFAAVWFLSVLAGNAVVRHDGPLSVRRAFTLDELARLAGECALPYLKARLEGRFRVSLAGEKERDA